MSKTKKKDQLSSLDPRVTGSIGGKTRAKNLTPQRRQEIARRASEAAARAREKQQLEKDSINS